MSFLSLDLSNDIKHLRVRAAGAAATASIRITFRFAGALICTTHSKFIFLLELGLSDIANTICVFAYSYALKLKQNQSKEH